MVGNGGDPQNEDFWAYKILKDYYDEHPSEPRELTKELRDLVAKTVVGFESKPFPEIERIPTLGKQRYDELQGQVRRHKAAQSAESSGSAEVPAEESRTRGASEETVQGHVQYPISIDEKTRVFGVFYDKK